MGDKTIAEIELLDIRVDPDNVQKAVVKITFYGKSEPTVFEKVIRVGDVINVVESGNDAKK